MFDEHIDQVLALMEEGATQTDIGRELGISSETVRNILARAGVSADRRNSISHWMPPPPPVSSGALFLKLASRDAGVAHSAHFRPLHCGIVDVLAMSALRRR